MRKVFVTAGVALLLLSATSMAFNGQRRGFVLGGGLGFAPESNWSTDFDFDDSGVGFGANFVIGGAFDEQNMLVYEGNVTGWNSDLVNTSVTQGFNGAAWYHYFGPTGRSAFTVAGIGFYVFQAEHYEDNDPGMGMLIGGGYEFSKHWQVGGYFSFGKTSDPIFDYNHHHISVLVSGIAF
ncbi:MAG: hypothetical protein NTW07_02680 [candidate division Zixibacteria bacterium]|nr:hypothetical protein [candidate division Zixibacteria bacterium]